MTDIFIHTFDSKRASTRSNVSPSEGFGRLVGASPIMQDLYKMIARIAPTKASIFITGESGTGKELVAQMIHAYSDRAQGPFIAINCGALTPELMGSALFGHEKGSFTGATQAHQGYFEQASGGTLFLDELPEAVPELQIKLLRVLETGVVIPVGGKKQVKVDVRVIAATNRNLEEAIHKGFLREDLYYRLGTFVLHTPPLRERGSDVVQLAEHFLEHFNKDSKKNKYFDASAIKFLTEHIWKGNVRELKNNVYRAFILADEDIQASHFEVVEHMQVISQHSLILPLDISLQEAKSKFIQAALAYHQYDEIKTAQVLDIDLATLKDYLNSK